jgi:hypothetical protein
LDARFSNGRDHVFFADKLADHVDRTGLDAKRVGIGHAARKNQRIEMVDIDLIQQDIRRDRFDRLVCGARWFISDHALNRVCQSRRGDPEVSLEHGLTCIDSWASSNSLVASISTRREGLRCATIDLLGYVAGGQNQ